MPLLLSPQPNQTTPPKLRAARWILLLLCLAWWGAILAWLLAPGPLRLALDPIDLPENAPLVADFKAFLKENGVLYFSARELLTPGGSHRSFGSAGFGLNRIPPKSQWEDMLETVFVLEELRVRFNGPLVINSGYRSPAYNKAVGGASRSYHQRFVAFDVAPSPVTPQAVERLYTLAKTMRDEEKRFTGGIGRYKGWVHIDVRDKNANW